MTKEELEKEAEKSLDKRLGTYAYIRKQDCYTPYVDGYTDGAEPREKQIQIDAEQIRALQKQNGELTDKVKELETELQWERDTKSELAELLGKANDKISELAAEVFFLKDSLNHEVELHQHAEEYIKSLEAQIEKMKCCSNCKHWFCNNSSISIDENGNRTAHKWNEEKQSYCDVGINGKYQCWELAE